MPRISLLLNFLAVFTSAQAADKTWIEFYDFSATGQFHVARKTGLKRVTTSVWIADESGNVRRHRYVMQNSRLDIGVRFEVENQEALKTETLYQQLQSFALKEMLERGYISPSLFEDVSYAMHIWKPGQIRFALDLMELSEAEAQKRYDEKIPWHRVMGGETFHPKDKPLTFVRASIMVGLGQMVNWKSGKIHTLPLSWEHYPDRHPLAFPEHSTPPPMAEFSRALAGDAVLGGSLSELIRLSLYWLEAEARLRGVAPDQYLLFAHGLDKAHARYFRQAFRMKQLTPESRQAIVDGRLDFAGLPAGTPDGERSVAFTTLAVASKIPALNTTGLSLTRSWRALICGSEARAHAFEREFLGGVFWHLMFPDEVQKTPVCIQDASPVALLPALEEVYRWQRDGDYSKLFNRAGNMKWDPNFWAPYWNRGAFLLPGIDSAEGVRPLGLVRIDNLSNPGEGYLREILAQVFAAQWHRLHAASPEARETILTNLRQLAQTLPPVPGASPARVEGNLSVDEILDHFAYVFFTDRPEVRDAAVRLGGKGFRGKTLTIPKIKVRLGAGGVEILSTEISGEGWGIVFRADQIRALAKGITPTATCSKHLLDYFLLQVAAQM